MQADAAQEEASAARKARDPLTARACEKRAAAAQRDALVATREAEASWAEALQLERTWQKLDAAADSGLRKAQRLSNVGERTGEAQELADRTPELKAQVQAHEAAARNMLGAAEREEQVGVLVHLPLCSADDNLIVACSRFHDTCCSWCGSTSRSCCFTYHSAMQT